MSVGKSELTVRYSTLNESRRTHKDDAAIIFIIIMGYDVTVF